VTDSAGSTALMGSLSVAVVTGAAAGGEAALGGGSGAHLLTGRPRVLHGLPRVVLVGDKSVGFAGVSLGCGNDTGYEGFVRIREIWKFVLIPGTWQDRSPIHSFYDYE
jgi:hypothetical protein